MKVEWVGMNPEDKCKMTLEDALAIKEEALSLVEEAALMLEEIQTSLADAKQMEEYAEELRLGKKSEPFYTYRSRRMKNEM